MKNFNITNTTKFHGFHEINFRAETSATNVGPDRWLFIDLLKPLSPTKEVDIYGSLTLKSGSDGIPQITMTISVGDYRMLKLNMMTQEVEILIDGGYGDGHYYDYITENELRLWAFEAWSKLGPELN